MQVIRNKNMGFTLIEVLVSVVILAIGLLGIAALQAASIRNTQNANIRSQAVFLAENLAARMRSNRFEASKDSTAVAWLLHAIISAIFAVDILLDTTSVTGTQISLYVAINLISDALVVLYSGRTIFIRP